MFIFEFCSPMTLGMYIINKLTVSLLVRLYNFFSFVV